MNYDFEINIEDKNNAHTLCLNNIKPNSKVLDIGCAVGALGDYLVRHKQCEVVGVDIDKTSLEKARTKNVYSELYELDLNAFQNQLDKYKGYFDYILLADVIEHVYNPEMLITSLKPLLKQNGAFIFSIPNIAHGSIKLDLLGNSFNYTEIGLLDKTHIRFFTLQSILEFFKKLGLKIENIDRVYNSFDNTNINLKLIEEDFESYVFQYIFKATQSNEKELEFLNYKKTVPKPEDIIEQQKFVLPAQKEKRGSLIKEFKKNLRRKQIVIVIHIYKNMPNEKELVSLKQCFIVLKNYDICFVALESLDAVFYENMCKKLNIKFNIKRFADNYFKGLDGYNKLMLNYDFYNGFRKYKFMLVHQLDAYVFKDDLLYWTKQGYDYIGAPWFEGMDNAGTNASLLPEIGNGGFSLRKIKPLLNILHKNQKFEKLTHMLSVDSSIRRVIKNYFDYKNSIEFYLENFKEYEDIFWAKHARYFDEKFKTPAPSEALKFSFECNPHILYKMNNEQLPFGCHAWDRYNYEFWKQFIRER